jgi:hypothetical protein
MLQMRIERVIVGCNLYMWKREVLTLFSNFALSLTLICAVSSVVEANTHIVDASLDIRRCCVEVALLMPRLCTSYEVVCELGCTGAKRWAWIAGYLCERGRIKYDFSIDLIGTELSIDCCCLSSSGMQCRRLIN